jgi:hypothetical protein
MKRMAKIMSVGALALVAGFGGAGGAFRDGSPFRDAAAVRMAAPASTWTKYNDGSLTPDDTGVKQTLIESFSGKNSTYFTIESNQYMTLSIAPLRSLGYRYFLMKGHMNGQLAEHFEDWQNAYKEVDDDGGHTLSVEGFYFDISKVDQSVTSVECERSDPCGIYGYAPDSTLVSGQTQDLYYYVPNVPTMADILGGITAKDLFGADCTVSCSDVERGKYTAKIGLSVVQITAADAYGQTATATLDIHIIDNGKPVIALAAGHNLSFVADTGASLKTSDLPSYFSVTDVGTGYGGTIGTPAYLYDGAAFTDHTFTSADFGQHTVNVKVSDSSGNQAAANFALTVTDGTAPVISRRDSSDVSTVIKVGVSRTFTLTKANFLQIFKATDNVDGDLSASMSIDGDFIGNRVGNYSVKIKASDKSGNTGSVTVVVQVIADLPPVFILSDTLVLATTDQALTTADMASIVTNGILSDRKVSAVSVDMGAYVGNENIAGDYTIAYDATVEGLRKSVLSAQGMSDGTINGSFTLRVQKASSDTPGETLDGWTAFWQKFVNWFCGVFTKFRFDCFITDAEWDSRFPAQPAEPSSSTPADSSPAAK